MTTPKNHRKGMFDDALKKRQSVTNSKPVKVNSTDQLSRVPLRATTVNQNAFRCCLGISLT
jgi:hypothetical protein